MDASSTPLAKRFRAEVIESSWYYAKLERLGPVTTNQKLLPLLPTLTVGPDLLDLQEFASACRRTYLVSILISWPQENRQEKCLRRNYSQYCMGVERMARS